MKTNMVPGLRGSNIASDLGCKGRRLWRTGCWKCLIPNPDVTIQKGQEGTGLEGQVFLRETRYQQHKLNSTGGQVYKTNDGIRIWGCLAHWQLVTRSQIRE